jgi:hypothetical protein
MLYYIIYSSRRRRKPKLEVHKLINGVYQLQSESPVWMPEVGLGIGYERGNYAGVTREWLYWYDEMGQRYPTPNERVQLEAQRAQLEAQRAQQEAQRAQSEAQRATISERRVEQLAQRLREMGVDPDSLS